MILGTRMLGSTARPISRLPTWTNWRRTELSFLRLTFAIRFVDPVAWG
ncbi:UNVERIFIED_CONTAM: hypothetical protein GTU68_006607 [Idotea baltica]|nr:hypothetical protein [Idotea baltica]